MFQSRNRGSFDFKLIPPFVSRASIKFQSRNRGSFDFKFMVVSLVYQNSCGFNLVIEVLLISSWTNPSNAFPRGTPMFQSRNRGSFDFKFKFRQANLLLLYRFNLVIEVLLISRVPPRGFSMPAAKAGFNLVIEVLLISRPGHSRWITYSSYSFQSRNRGSFDFKLK